MLTGGCFCGRVRYQAHGEPFHMTICHCASCRRAAGAASVAWFSVLRSRFVTAAAEPARFRSSPKVVRGFCDACGTSLTYESEESPDEIGVTICSLDAPDSIVPENQIHVVDKPAWSAVCDGRPAYPGEQPIS